MRNFQDNNQSFNFNELDTKMTLELNSNLNESKYSLENQSHAFIVFLGALIGGIIAVFIGYHLDTTFIHYAFLSVLPLSFAYGLRKVYINTLAVSD
jgi:uncharacterized membrane protein YfcA